MPCEYWDCGWCYAPEDAETTAEGGECNRMTECPQSWDWPETKPCPINLMLTQSAFYFSEDDDDNDTNS